MTITHPRGCLCELCHAMMLGMPQEYVGVLNPGKAWLSGYAERAGMRPPYTDWSKEFFPEHYKNGYAAADRAITATGGLHETAESAAPDAAQMPSSCHSSPKP